MKKKKKYFQKKFFDKFFYPKIINDFFFFSLQINEMKESDKIKWLK